ncbi:MAG TPA: hypothetical protein VI636_11950 [Candidatus Angelobacter sp.]
MTAVKTNYRAALKALADGGVNFVVIGAYAAVLQGSAQITQDLDICYERTSANMKRLAASLAPYHPRLRGAPDGVPFVLDEHALAQGMSFTLETDLGDIDLIGELSALGPFSQIVHDAVRLPLFDGACLVAGLDTLIRSKRAAGRPKDLRALPELEALKELHESEQKDKKNR